MPKEALYRRMLTAHTPTKGFDAKHGHVTERDVTSRKCIYRFQSLYSIIYGPTRENGSGSRTEKGAIRAGNVDLLCIAVSP